MKKIDKLENFINLNKTDKKNLTISWLIELIKTEHLSIEDVIDILNNIEPTFSKVDKLECLLINGQISTSTISRVFGFGYAKSSRIINCLVQKSIIAKYDNCYKIIDKANFKLVTKELVEGWLSEWNY